MRMDVLSILRRVGEMGTVAIDNSPNAAHNALHAHTRRVYEKSQIGKKVRYL